MRWIVGFAMGSLMLAGPALAQGKDTIQNLNERFQQAFNKGDIAAVAQMYTQDAYVMPPGADLVRGRDNIQKFWQAAHEQVGDLRLNALEVRPLGTEAAREIGTFTLQPKGQRGQPVAGKYVVIWQKDDGEWKLATDIWNANK
jgi:uncharacterized protein (TIGR02246 family)